MTGVPFDKTAFLFLSINHGTIENVTIKTSQKLKFNSELNDLTGCQVSNVARTVVFAINSNEDPIAVFWGK